MSKRLTPEKLNLLIDRAALPSDIASRDNTIRELRRYLRAARTEAADYRKRFETMTRLGDPYISKIVPQVKGPKTEGIAILQASDWHVEELVEPKNIGGYPNRYNPGVARKRADNFFRISQRLLDIIARDLKINTIVLALLGDFITNELHEDSAENNSMRPTEAAMYAQDLISSGIRLLLDSNPDRRILVICHSGNHGRVTKRVHHAQEHGHSLEYMVYCNIAQYFSSEHRITFNVSESYHSYTKLFGTLVRCHHGHKILYNGGVGGITIPVNKAIAQWDKGRQAQLDLFGHFHTLLDGNKWAANGSLIGYNAYAVSIKAEPEPPAQWFHIIDTRRGRTWRAPIFVDK